MIEKIYSSPEIYNIYVPLPNNPLKNLNCYVVLGNNEALVIDTGFNMPECYEALTEGLKELNIDIEKTYLFLTHCHSDHTGLASIVFKDNSKIFMGKDDFQLLTGFLLEPNNWGALESRFISEGFPKSYLEELESTNPAKVYASEKCIEPIIVNDSDIINLCGFEFEVISTNGHTPGHMCLYLKEKEIMFLGDHILFDITPNITFWDGVENSLKDYLISLEKISKYSVKLALPSHRKNEMDLQVRIEQIKNHHKDRLKEVIDIITNQSGLNAYEISSKMTWSMRGKPWIKFPIHQQWFAVGEGIAHLDYLYYENKIKKIKENDIYKYYLV